MQLVGKQALHIFMQRHADTRPGVTTWIAEVEDAKWYTPNDLKRRYPKASILSDRNVIFDFCWNKYRLWVVVSYKNQAVMVKRIGTHKEYDKWIIKGKSL